MSSPHQSSDREPEEVAAASAFLAERGIPATAREFRLRQEFFRYGWDVRVRDEGSEWTVHALKPDRPEVIVHASSEANALRLAVAAVIQSDDASGP